MWAITSTSINIFSSPSFSTPMSVQRGAWLGNRCLVSSTILFVTPSVSPTAYVTIYRRIDQGRVSNWQEDSELKGRHLEDVVHRRPGVSKSDLNVDEGLLDLRVHAFAPFVDLFAVFPST